MDTKELQISSPHVCSLEERPEFVEQTLKLIEKSFGYSSEHSFQTDFYPLVNKKNFNSCYILVDENKKIVLAHVGAMRKFIYIQNKILPITFLGGICVNSEHRGQGLFKNIFGQVLNKYLDKSAFVMLWTDLFELYEKYSFYPCIGLVEVKQKTNPQTPETKLERTKFKNLNEEEKREISELYKNYLLKEFTSIWRGPIDWESITHITSSDLFLERDDSNKIIGYFFKGKGQDLGGVIHEIIHKKNLANFVQTAATFGNVWLPEKYISLFKEGQPNFTGLLRIANQELFNEFLSIWSDNKIKVKHIAKEIVYFEFKGQVYSRSIKDFLCLILGPYPAIEFKNQLRPIYISGLDSI